MPPKLPPAVLVALGLSGCTCREDVTRPCLNISIVETDDVGPCLEMPPVEEPPVEDPDMGPCLKMAPCLELAEPTQGPCLSPPADPDPPEPRLGPCLKVMAPRGPPPGTEAEEQSDDQGSLRAPSILDRDVLPPDVVQRLRGRPG